MLKLSNLQIKSFTIGLITSFGLMFHITPFEGVSPINDVDDQTINKVCKRFKECEKLAEAIVWEARGESDTGMQAVAYVIMNRVSHPKKWSKTITGVINQTKQFSYHADKHLQNAPKKADWFKARIIAYRVIHNIAVNPIGESVFYHSTKIKPPKWTKSLIVYATIGNHIFYKEEK